MPFSDSVETSYQYSVGSSGSGGTAGNVITANLPYPVIEYTAPVYPWKIRIVKNGYIVLINSNEFVFNDSATLLDFLSRDLINREI